MGYNQGYTQGMKTAISIPDAVFTAAEDLARRLEMSRSELYANAVRAFLAQHADESVTARLNKLYKTEDSRVGQVAEALQLFSLPREEW